MRLFSQGINASNVLAFLRFRLCFLLSFLLVTCLESCEKSSISLKDVDESIISVQKYSVNKVFRLSDFGAEPFSGSSQGMDIFDNKILFQAGLAGNIIHVLDLQSQICLGSIEFIAPVRESSHMNNINCGSKYIDSDFFPLLYLSQTTNSHSCFVLRLSNDANSYELVQRIRYNGKLHHQGRNYDWCIDTNNGYIYSYGRYNDIIDVREIVKFPLPSLDNSEVTFTDEDVIDSFVLDNMSVYQGSRIIDGLLFAPVGCGTEEYPGFLKIIDLEKKELKESIALECGEPESIGVYRSGAIICGGRQNPAYYYIQL